MRHVVASLVAVVLVSLSACGPSPPSGGAPPEEGTWTGTLTPMNHPDTATPLTYEMQSEDGTLLIDLIADETMLPTRDVHMEGDTLFFAFNEPEADVPLQCALGRDGSEFTGRCADASGKWARFTMPAAGVEEITKASF